MKPTATPVSSATEALGRALEASLRLERSEPAPQRSGLWRPVCDIKLTPQEMMVLIDLPGIDEDTIGIAIVGGTLKVTGMRDFDHDGEDAEEFVQIDRLYGPYALDIPLPLDANPANMTAKYKRGVLKIRVPRRRGGDQ